MKAGEKLLTLLLVSLFIGSAMGAFSGRTEAQEGSPRTVILELVTANWCAGCPYADEAADELSVDFGPERFSVVQYHVSLQDGLSIPESEERGDDYGKDVTGLPAAWFDGIEDVTQVGEPDSDFFYELYKPKIEERLKLESPLEISLTLSSPFYLMLNVSALYTETLDIAETRTINARYVLYENSVDYQGTIYNYVVRDLEERVFDKDGLPYTEEVSFPLSGPWNPENLGVVVFVQIEDTGEVLQSANIVKGTKPTVSITTDLEGKVIQETTRIEGTASAGVQSVEIRIDEELYERAEGTTSWYYNVDPSRLSEGKHTLTVRAYTSSLVYSESEVAEFEVETAFPLTMAIALVIIVVIVIIIVVVVLRTRKSGEKE